MSFLLVLALLIAVAVVPIMIGARIVKAQHTGFGSALFAVILLSALSLVINKFITNQFLSFVASAAGGGFFLSFVLGTTFWRGIAVSIIAVALQVAFLVFFAGAILGGAAVVA